MAIKTPETDPEFTLDAIPPRPARAGEGGRVLR
jgi:hypothetical protein